MRVVIAGGSGLIGQALTKELASQNNEIIILSRNPGKNKSQSTSVSFLFWDGETVGNWIDSVNGADAIINLVGKNLSGERFFPSRWTDARKAQLISSRLNAGKVLCQAIEMVNIKPAAFVQSSGISFYGTDPVKIFTEEDPAGNDFLANLSVKWEASTKAVEAFGVRRVIIRSAIVLSTKSGALPRLTLPYKLFVGGRLGTGRQIYTWIHIDDEVSAIKYLIENKTAEGIFNLAAPNPLTNNEFGKIIAQVLHRPHYFPIPGLVMRLAFGEVASVVLEGQKVLPSTLLQLGYKFQYPHLKEALEDIFQRHK